MQTPVDKAFNHQSQNMKVAIVGATGQTGSIIAKALLSETPKFVRCFSQLRFPPHARDANNFI